jgi:hypothetical protein
VGSCAFTHNKDAKDKTDEPCRTAKSPNAKPGKIAFTLLMFKGKTGWENAGLTMMS